VTLEELMVSTLAMVDAVTKLDITARDLGARKKGARPDRSPAPHCFSNFFHLLKLATQSVNLFSDFRVVSLDMLAG
jgi:hypothetical protein